MIDCEFPGGNIVVDAIEGDTVSLHQDLRDTRGDWFYWYFRVRGAAGRTLNFKFTKGNYTYLMMRVPTQQLQQQYQMSQAQLQNLIVGGKVPQKPMSTQDFLRQYEIARAMPRPERGKIGGKSKYLPKTLKPPSKEKKEELLNMCREMYKDVPEEPTIKEAEE